jgi:peroxiredoxin
MTSSVQFPSSEQEPQPSRSGRWLNSLAVAVSLVALVLLAGYIIWPVVSEHDHGSQNHPAVGQKLPDLQLQSLTGQDRSLTLKDLDGHVALIAFWGTWCEPCRRELPHLANAAKTFANEPSFQLVAVSCGSGPEDMDELRADTELYLQRAKLNIEAYADPKMATRRAFDSVGEMRGYPTTFLLDRHGVIQRVWAGYHEDIEDDLMAIVPSLLK